MRLAAYSGPLRPSWERPLRGAVYLGDFSALRGALSSFSPMPALTYARVASVSNNGPWGADATPPLSGSSCRAYLGKFRARKGDVKI